MKATKIISACAVLVSLASCSNDHVISQPGAEDTPIRIQANVGAVTTKAASDIQGSQFDQDEYIIVYLFQYFIRFLCKKRTLSGSCSFIY